ncbi:MAG: hypothetical protein R2697_10130 [Ilumatobacteraceae bacterium]
MSGVGLLVLLLYFPDGLASEGRHLLPRHGRSRHLAFGLTASGDHVKAFRCCAEVDGRPRR